MDNTVFNTLLLILILAGLLCIATNIHYIQLDIAKIAKLSENNSGIRKIRYEPFR